MADNVDQGKRRMLVVATSAVGTIGGIGAALPFVMSMTPSAKARAAGAPVEVDLSKIEPGMLLTVAWRGKPIWVLNRTEAMLKTLPEVDSLVSDPNSKVAQQPKYADNEYRSIKPKYLVLIGICTHLGCSPSQKLQPGAEGGMSADWHGGFFCPCHGSRFDLAGRVYKGSPAPTNLVVPPYTYLSDTRLLIGSDSTGA